MDKEQYFHDVRYNQGAVMYAMYKEKFDEKRHKPFLQGHEFIMYLQMSGMMNEAFESACRYYEHKFNINKLFDKEGKLIRFV